jgi:hypothetical protein
MKKLTFILTGILSAGLLVSCETTTNIAQGTTDFYLAKADYKVSGDTTGKACVDYILGFPFVKEKNLENKYAFYSPFSNMSRNMTAARYDALSKVKDATYFVESRIETVTTPGFFVTERCTIVYGKAITVTGSSSVNN